MAEPVASPGASTPKRRRRQNRDAQVVEAAINVFCEKGFAAAALQDVAEAVGMLKGSLYYYFDSKEQLLFRILTDAHEQVLEIFREVEELDAPPLARLRGFLIRHIVWYLQNLQLARVTFHEWRNLTGDMLAEQTDRRRLYDGFVQDLVKASQASGDISTKLPVTLATNYLLGAINALPDWYNARGRKSPKAIATLYADLTIAMLTGWRPPVAGA
jgi:AcrR family transcriptional regulator